MVSSFSFLFYAPGQGKYQAADEVTANGLSGLRKLEKSSTLTELLAESPLLTRYRLLRLQFKF